MPVVAVVVASALGVGENLVGLFDLAQDGGGLFFIHQCVKSEAVTSVGRLEPQISRADLLVRGVGGQFEDFVVSGIVRVKHASTVV